MQKTLGFSLRAIPCCAWPFSKPYRYDMPKDRLVCFALKRGSFDLRRLCKKYSLFWTKQPPRILTMRGQYNHWNKGNTELHDGHEFSTCIRWNGRDNVNLLSFLLENPKTQPSRAPSVNVQFCPYHVSRFNIDIVNGVCLCSHLARDRTAQTSEYQAKTIGLAA